MEEDRLALQTCLDDEKSQTERNRLGQFATPPALAEAIARYAADLLTPAADVRFLDPAVGTGAFYSALLKVYSEQAIKEALGFEIDSHYGDPAARLWKSAGLTLKIGDFTLARPSPRFNLILCNPPYVRHHHLPSGRKRDLQIRAERASGMKLSGLAGLYCYFLGLAHPFMAKGGVAGWLIPSEFLDVRYGQAVKKYLTERVTLLHIHRFDSSDVQFADALVSSSIVWLKNTPPPKDHRARLTFGGSLLEPTVTRSASVGALAHEPKWSRLVREGARDRKGSPRLGDFFRVKRGIATGNNDYFILSEERIRSLGLPAEVLTPIFPGPRRLSQDIIRAKEDGSPDIEERLFLLNTALDEEEIRRRFPALYAYLQEGRARGLHERYLCSHRSPWYKQEKRPSAPIVCTYLGRRDTKVGRPFRFILNESRATVANQYLAMYPTDRLRHALLHNRALLVRIWERLNRIAPAELLGEGRAYGGGLYKLEPRELEGVDGTFFASLLADFPNTYPVG